MKYKVEYSQQAAKQLKKLDRHVSLLIFGWIDKNLQGCTDPRRFGKSLTGNLGGQWRYRVGDYRILAEISDETITILVLNIGHRKEIYKW